MTCQRPRRRGEPTIHCGKTPPFSGIPRLSRSIYTYEASLILNTVSIDCAASGICRDTRRAMTAGTLTSVTFESVYMPVPISISWVLYRSCWSDMMFVIRLLSTGLVSTRQVVSLHAHEAGTHPESAQNLHRDCVAHTDCGSPVHVMLSRRCACAAGIFEQKGYCSTGSTIWI
jgi:hypothetical protein